MVRTKRLIVALLLAVLLLFGYVCVVLTGLHSANLLSNSSGAACLWKPCPAKHTVPSPVASTTIHSPAPVQELELSRDTGESKRAVSVRRVVLAVRAQMGKWCVRGRVCWALRDMDEEQGEESGAVGLICAYGCCAG